MHLNEARICGITLGLTRAEVETALGWPAKVTRILDDNETCLIYDPRLRARVPLFGPPRDGLTVRISRFGMVRVIWARTSSLVLGGREVQISDTYEEVRSLLKSFDPECTQDKRLDFSDSTAKLRIGFRDGAVCLFELGKERKSVYE